jgi:hypothetical protein
VKSYVRRPRLEKVSRADDHGPFGSENIDPERARSVRSVGVVDQAGGQPSSRPQPFRVSDDARPDRHTLTRALACGEWHVALATTEGHYRTDSRGDAAQDRDEYSDLG